MKMEHKHTKTTTPSSQHMSYLFLCPCLFLCPFPYHSFRPFDDLAIFFQTQQRNRSGRPAGFLLLLLRIAAAPAAARPDAFAAAVDASGGWKEMNLVLLLTSRQRRLQLQKDKRTIGKFSSFYFSDSRDNCL
jgi:hypothetical protein